jgi:serine/threonine protein phosphatase PrpC
MASVNAAIEKRGLAGESCCGDDAGAWEAEGKVVLCLADGLGHGREAERAAREAVGYVGSHLAVPMRELFDGCNAALRDTRGAAMAVAVVDRHRSTLSFAGVGNVRGLATGTPTTRLTCDFGTLGAGFRRLAVETVHLETGSLVILASDGLSERFEVSAYDEAVRRSPRALATRLLSDWTARPPDDAAVLVYLHDGRGT